MVLSPIFIRCQSSAFSQKTFQGLYKLVQVITVHQVTSQQAKSKFQKVFCLFSQPIMTSWQEPTSFGILVQAGLKDIGSNNHIKIHTIDTK